MPPSVLVLGGSGYVGQAFVRELTRRGWHAEVLRRQDVDYTRFGRLLEFLRQRSWDFVVNCAGYRGRPNVDACEQNWADTIRANTVLPETVANACEAAGVPWGHVSSGCVFRGARIRQPDGSWQVEADLTTPAIRRILREEPERVLGYTESDPSNFTFRSPPCSFYSGAKALGEEALLGAPRCYVWRCRMPFDEVDDPNNFLSKLQRYPKVYDNFNSISHLGDFAWACVELWRRDAEYGVYNVTNPGFVSTRDVVERIRCQVDSKREFAFWPNDEQFYRAGARTPRSNCILNVAKLLATGVVLRPIEDALDDALRRWVPSPASASCPPNLVPAVTP